MSPRTRHRVAAAACVVLASACTNVSSGQDMADPASETPVPVQHEADDPGADVGAAPPPEAGEEDAVTAAYVNFVAATHQFNLRRIDVDDVLAHRDVDVAPTREDWEPADIHGGERVARPIEIVVDGDSATLVDCMHDTTIATDDAPGGLWFENTAELVRDADGVWKVADWSQWHGGELELCFHPDDRERLEQVMHRLYEGWFGSIGQRNAPEFRLDALDGIVRPADIRLIYDGLNREQADKGRFVRSDTEWDVDFRLVMPDGVDALLCLNELNWTEVDIATGEIVEHYDGAIMRAWELTFVPSGDSWALDTWDRQAGDVADCEQRHASGGFRFEFSI